MDPSRVHAYVHPDVLKRQSLLECMHYHSNIIRMLLGKEVLQWEEGVVCLSALLHCTG